MADPRRLTLYSQKDHLRLLNRLLAEMDVIDDCWVWTGSKNGKGYGSIMMDGRVKTAHRVVFEIMRGPVPDDLSLDHLCRNPACVNPDHLEPVTSRENTLRGVGVAAVNARKTHCIRGHEFTPENTKIRRDGRGRQCRECNREWIQRRSRPK